jgi:hypothetical protein
VGEIIDNWGVLIMQLNTSTGDDLASLHLHAKRLIRAGVRPSTARTYSSAQNRFLNFCGRYGLLPIPCTEDTLVLYVAFLHREGLRPGTVRVYLAGIRSLHIEEGYGNPLEGSLRLARAIRALDITCDKPHQKLPITLDIMELLKDKLPLSYVVGSNNTSILWLSQSFRIVCDINL